METATASKEVLGALSDLVLAYLNTPLVFFFKVPEPNLLLIFIFYLFFGLLSFLLLYVFLHMLRRLRFGKRVMREEDVPAYLLKRIISNAQKNMRADEVPERVVRDLHSRLEVRDISDELRRKIVLHLLSDPTALDSVLKNLESDFSLLQREENEIQEKSARITRVREILVALEGCFEPQSEDQSNTDTSEPSVVLLAPQSG